MVPITTRGQGIFYTYKISDMVYCVILNYYFHTMQQTSTYYESIA